MNPKNLTGDVKDTSLTQKGINRIEWAAREMPVLNEIRKRFTKDKPLNGLILSACLHVTSETANLALTLRDGGAQVALCASNPLSTQDDIAAALTSHYEIPTFAIKGEDDSTYYQHLNSVLDFNPNITLDDGADLVALLHTERTDALTNIIGGCEETTTGVIRLKSLSTSGELKYPIVAVNDADTKHFFDNRYGTGQSTLDGITRATNVLWAGKKVVVIGYGWCGRGVATRAKGMGAQTIITEVVPIKALEAAMDGHEVMKMEEASKTGDIFISLTGGLNAVNTEHINSMKDGALIANSGHFNVEINIDALDKLSVKKQRVKDFVDEYTLKDGRKVYLLGEGRLVNLAAAEGHPSAVMDMSFANQALSTEYMYKNASSLKAEVYPVPKSIDKEVGKLKLMSMGIDIDTLTDEQEKYLASWEIGT